MAASGKKNLLMGVTGSVATIKIVPIVTQLLPVRQENTMYTMSPPHLTSYQTFNIRLVTTKRALHFFKPADIPRAVQVLQDDDEWNVRM